MWKQLKVTDVSGVKRYLAELAKQRDHYATRTFDDIKKYFYRKRDIECWIYEGDGFSVGILLYYKRKTLEGPGAYYLANAWYTGTDWNTATDLIIEKMKEYCEKHNADTIYHIQAKDMKGECSDLKLTQPHRLDKNFLKLQLNFKAIEMNDQEDYTHITLTL